MRAHLRGLIAATFTPLRDDGSLALDRVPEYVDRLLADPIDGLYVLGSTGEGVLLTGNERREVAEAFVTASAGRVPVVVQCGHHSVREARELATHAARIGATAVSAVLPTYFPLRDVDALVGALAEIAAGAPALPFYAYHAPHMTGASTDVLALLAALEQRVPNLGGVKYTATTVWEFQACVDAFGDRLDLLYGCDEMLLSGLVAGAHGCVGSTYNFAAPLYRRVLDAFARGDLDGARRAQSQSVAFVRVLFAHGGMPAIKATMGLCGLDVGPVRSPLHALDAAAVERLREDFEAIGFFAAARGEGLA